MEPERPPVMIAMGYPLHGGHPHTETIFGIEGTIKLTLKVTQDASVGEYAIYIESKCPDSAEVGHYAVVL